MFFLLRNNIINCNWCPLSCPFRFDHSIVRSHYAIVFMLFSISTHCELNYNRHIWESVLLLCGIWKLVHICTVQYAKSLVFLLEDLHGISIDRRHLLLFNFQLRHFKKCFFFFPHFFHHFSQRHLITDYSFVGWMDGWTGSSSVVVYIIFHQLDFERREEEWKKRKRRKEDSLLECAMYQKCSALSRLCLLLPSSLLVEI